MAYVGLDIRGARDLAKVLQDTATRTETVRRESVGALKLADLSSQVPLQLALVQDGFSRLAMGVVNKAELAEQFTVDPQRVATGMGVAADQLGVAITDLIGFGGPADLRAVLVGLGAPGADPALDAALARLSPAVLPALMAGQRPELAPAQVADLRLLALRLGIEHAGPSALPEGVARNGRNGTEVFWQDFWADGATVAEVLADPGRLVDWVAGTFELDRRLAVATGLPALSDVVATYDFATTGGHGEVATIVAETEVAFPAIGTWLPAYLVGQDRTEPDAAQLEQTLAFAGRVGWVDPGAAAGTPAQRFADAVAFLRANRLLQSALLPTGFQGDPEPLAFFNEPGIRQILELGRRTGVLNDATVTGLGALLDRGMATLGVDLSKATPVELTEPLQQQLFALVASQIPAALAQSPAIQGQFIAAVGYLRQAATGPELRQRIIEVVAAFRTIAVTCPPALTERQLTEVVGGSVFGVLGRARIRLRSTAAVRKNPEFLLVARQWGIPGGHKQDLGKFKFTWSFDELGALTAIRRKKKSTLSRVFDTIKSVGKAILESWKDNPFKAIFQVGKIALGVASLFVPGLGLGAAALALNLGEAALHAVEGDWLAAIGSGLAAFTAGAEVFGHVSSTLLQSSQAAFVKTLFDGDDTLNFLVNAKRALDIGTSVVRFTQADSLLGSIGAGLGAFSTALGNGGELLRSAGADASLVSGLVQFGTTARDLTRIVTPAAGLIQAIDSGDLVNAFGNGLLAVSAGASALADPKGVFGSPTTLGSSLFGFDKDALAALKVIGQGTGVAGNVTRAIAAADAGQAFLAGSFLAQAVVSLNDPRHTVLGNHAVVTQRIAEVGSILQKVFAGANPKAAAPLVVDGLSKVVDALGTSVNTRLAAVGAPAATAVGIPGGDPAASSAEPTSAELTSAELTSAELTSAELSGAELSGAELSGGSGAGTIVNAFGGDTLSGAPDAHILLGSFGGNTLGGGEGDDRLLGDGETAPFVLAGLGTGSGPALLDRLPNIPDLEVPKDSALDKDGRPIDNWFSEGFAGMSTESLRAQARQLGVDAESQRFDARVLGAVQQSGQFIGGVTGATVLGVWGATQGAITGVEFGPYGAILNGTIGGYVGARKGYYYGGLAGQALGTGVFNAQIRELNLGANQSEAMQQILNSEVYRREVEERFAYQASVERLAPEGTALSFGSYDRGDAVALDATVIPQPTLMPEGTVLPDGSLLPEEGAGLDGAPDLMRMSVDVASDGMSPFGEVEAPFVRDSAPEFSFQHYVPYYGDAAPMEPAGGYDFGDVEMFSFDESSTFDTGDLVYE